MRTYRRASMITMSVVSEAWAAGRGQLVPRAGIPATGRRQPGHRGGSRGSPCLPDGYCERLWPWVGEA